MPRMYKINYRLANIVRIQDQFSLAVNLETKNSNYNMSISAFLLILIAALCHSTWNFLMKQANGKLIFLWLIALVGGMVFSPLIAWLLFTGKAQLNFQMLVACAVSALLTLIFYFTLQHAYRKGELSVIYPTTRGTGVLFTILLAILIFNEELTLKVSAGIIISTGGLIFLGYAKKKDQNLKDPIGA